MALPVFRGVSALWGTVCFASAALGRLLLLLFFGLFDVLCGGGLLLLLLVLCGEGVGLPF